MRWVLVGFIGVLTGVVAFLIDICVKNLFRLKFSLFEKCKLHAHPIQHACTWTWTCTCTMHLSVVHIMCMAVVSILCLCAVFNKTEDNGEIIFGFLVLLGFNVVFAIIASTLVACEVSLLAFQLDVPVLSP